MNKPAYLQVITTLDQETDAHRLAATLVERRLAACVQIVGPIQSVYRWQENIEHSEEWQCIAKTEQRLFAAVELAIRELHSYDCPEIIAVPIVAGSSGYLDWLSEQVGGGE